MPLRTVRVPEEIAPAFAAAEEVVGRYFADRKHDPERGTIEIFGERYVLVRAASLSVEFVTLVRSLYGAGREEEADEFARNILYDLAHAIGRSDARNFHAKMKLDDPIARLSAGPIHFAHAGWAFVDISAESKPLPNEEFYLLYDHPYSFEANAWIAAGRAPSFPACVMNAGYSSGWCEESFGVTLVASEILCRARGDEACRFVMAHPTRIEAAVAKHAPAPGYAIPDFFARKRMEEELRKSRDELDARVKARTAELERANAQLAQSQKLEAVGRLAGGVAHDFNNLLGVILGRSSMVQARVQENDPLWQDMEAIRNACRQGASLTRHMIAFSRREATPVLPLDLAEVVRGFALGLLPLIGEDAELALETEPSQMLGDHGRLEQILMNLVVNARDAMPSGGTLTIRTGVADLPETPLASGTLPAGRYATLVVKDTGAGMSPETLSKIFEPFFSTKSPASGTGLGLSTVYGIVQQLRGGIEVVSAVGLGSTFTLYFPWCEAIPEKARAPASTSPRIVTTAARVLLVEDQEDLRDALEDGLVDAGYQVIAVGDPQAAVALVEKGDLELDVLVTDLLMPKLGGRQLAARLRLRRPRVRVVYISGFDRES
ncbi:MAG TPA: ATP-binding protein, partial [Labilithrix sp.]